MQLLEEQVLELERLAPPEPADATALGHDRIVDYGGVAGDARTANTAVLAAGDYDYDLDLDDDEDFDDDDDDDEEDDDEDEDEEDEEDDDDDEEEDEDEDPDD